MPWYKFLSRHPGSSGQDTVAYAWYDDPILKEDREDLWCEWIGNTPGTFRGELEDIPNLSDDLRALLTQRYEGRRDEALRMLQIVKDSP